jgi:DNA end-binding protein Ku
VNRNLRATRFCPAGPALAPWYRPASRFAWPSKAFAKFVAIVLLPVTEEYRMPPRANWKGYLRLSLVSCPIALYPASSLSEKVSFNRINRKTGNRLKQQNVDSETGEVVPREDIARGYEIGKGQYLIIEDEEFEAVEVESTRTIDIDEFVPRKEIDDRYIDSPYYIAPDGQVGQDAFAVIRDTIGKMNMVALGRVVLTRREHVIALEPRGRGLLGMTLRYPYEVRDEQPYFEDIPELKLPKDMMDLAGHIVSNKSGHFDPSHFEDRYENALIDLLKKKEAGEKIAPVRGAPPPRVVNLMDALRASIDAEKKKAPAPSTQVRRPAKKKASQK